jgi:hypothetical protein
MSTKNYSDQSFLMVAIDTQYGLAALVELGAGMHIIRSMGILAGFCLETSLKACLMQNEITSEEIRKIGHDIRTLWDKAAKFIHLETPIPAWAECLAENHKTPYAYRYPEHQHYSGIQDPELLPIELNKIIKQLIRKSSYIF